MKKVLILLSLMIGVVLPHLANAQCDTIAKICNKHVTKGYISDGQAYRSLLLNDEVSEFHVTLYGGSTYRIAACSGLTDGNLIFSLYDSQRNLLFTNKDYKNAPYWDFKVTHTIDCIIEAHLDPSISSSGCAVVLLSFKK